jgi:hypothetical protein
MWTNVTHIMCCARPRFAPGPETRINARLHILDRRKVGTRQHTQYLTSEYVPLNASWLILVRNAKITCSFVRAQVFLFLRVPFLR